MQRLGQRVIVQLPNSVEQHASNESNFLITHQTPHPYYTRAPQLNRQDVLGNQAASVIVKSKKQELQHCDDPLGSPLPCAAAIPIGEFTDFNRGSSSNPD